MGENFQQSPLVVQIYAEHRLVNTMETTKLERSFILGIGGRQA